MDVDEAIASGDHQEGVTSFDRLAKGNAKQINLNLS